MGDRCRLGRWFEDDDAGSVAMTGDGRNDPLHGVTLQMMLDQLVAQHGWDGLGRLIDIRCFTHDPSIKSSLTFLRRTPWARAKVEALYRRSAHTRPPTSSDK